MSVDRLRAAKTLIDQRRYAEARDLLEGVPGVKAEEWRRKLDARIGVVHTYLPDAVSFEAVEPRRRGSTRGCIGLAVALMVGLAIGAIAALVAFQPPAVRNWLLGVTDRELLITAPADFAAVCIEQVSTLATSFSQLTTSAPGGSAPIATAVSGICKTVADVLVRDFPQTTVSCSRQYDIKSNIEQWVKCMGNDLGVAAQTGMQTAMPMPSMPVSESTDLPPLPIGG